MIVTGAAIALFNLSQHDPTETTHQTVLQCVVFQVQYSTVQYSIVQYSTDDAPDRAAVRRVPGDRLQCCVLLVVLQLFLQLRSIVTFIEM